MQLQPTDTEFQIIREQLTAAHEKRELLEAQVADFRTTQKELDSVKALMYETHQSEQKLSAEVSRLKTREAELSKDLAEKEEIKRQLTARVRDLLKSAVDPEQGRELLYAAISARKALEDEVARLKVIYIQLLTQQSTSHTLMIPLGRKQRLR